ncbi:MAG: hypothetical protein K6E17_06415 [Clostridiales bacterium]|nr:hypothetical protein [Clostridiales bacterium]
MRKARLRKMRTEKTRIRKALTVLVLLAALCALWAGAAAESAATPTDLRPAEIRPEIPGGTKDEQGIWHLTRSDGGILRVTWNDTGADMYGVILCGPDSLIRTAEVTAPAWQIVEVDLPAGEYTLEITARSDGAAAGSANLRLMLEEAAGEPAEEPAEEPAQEPVEEPAEEPAQEPAEEPQQPEEPGNEPTEPEEQAGEPGEEGPEGRPSGGFPSGGGKPSGGRPSGGSWKGGTGTNTQTARITAGKALTTTHAKGSGDTRAYGTVELTAAEGSMQVLVLGDEELALDCGGNEFTATLEEDALILRTDGEDAWNVGMDVLKTLNLSGVRQVELISPDAETMLETDMELSGSAYGRERARGYVSADFLLTRQEGEWRVRVEDREYRLSELTTEE